MSDTPPDRKEADDAPAAPKNPWVGWLVWVIVAPVLYVLSAGPAWWLHKKGYLPESFGMVYYPLSILPDYFQAMIDNYYHWWTP